MKVMGLQGVIRGKKVITTNPDAAQPCPDDKVNRAFVAEMPNQLWVSDFTYVPSWQGMVSFGPCPRTDGGQALTFRDRCLRPEDRRLARLDLDDHRPSPWLLEPVAQSWLDARRPESGHLPEGTVRG